MSFENKLNKLREIVTALESGDLELEKSVELYSEGMKLSVDCKNELETAQLRIVSDAPEEQ
ncbi:MAG: exodeoxyribonuclease VII small subunit [Oscillospiraceae bacterium]|nr:exodeoxyribonuclease VII small subunit [Oscillospiraceae bacterium]